MSYDIGSFFLGVIKVVFGLYKEISCVIVLVFVVFYLKNYFLEFICLLGMVLIFGSFKNLNLFLRS